MREEKREREIREKTMIATYTRTLPPKSEDETCIQRHFGLKTLLFSRLVARFQPIVHCDNVRHCCTTEFYLPMNAYELTVACSSFVKDSNLSQAKPCVYVVYVSFWHHLYFSIAFSWTVLEAQQYFFAPLHFVEIQLKRCVS